MKNINPRQKSGFTLIEMLVVIAIIALLVTLLTPGISMMLERSKLTTCANRLKNIHHAFMQYGIEHEGHFPTPKGPATGAERRFAYYVNPYLDPSWDNRYSVPPQFKCPLITEYNLNTHTVGFNHYMGGEKIRSPGSSKTIMLGDTKSAYSLFQNRWINNFHFRHNDPTRKGIGKWSVVYADGHWDTLEYGTPLITTPHEKCALLNPARNR